MHLLFSALPLEVADRLGYYVYVLRDPRDGTAFYVGKGVGSRLFAHIHESEGIGDYAKLARIRDIHAAGLDVEHLVVRHGLDEESDAFVVEQSVIDALTATGVALTNRVKGHAASDFGLSTIDAMVTKYQAPQLPPLTRPTIMVIINRFWTPDLMPDDVYRYTHGHWKVGERSRTRAEVVLGVAFGVVRGAYEVDDWFPSPQPGEEGRWGFNGRATPDLEEYVGKSVLHLVPAKGAQNPVRLFLDV